MLRNKEPELAEKIDTHSGVLTSVFTASISFLAPGTLLLSVELIDTENWSSMQADTKNGESTFDGTKESAHLMKPRKAFDQLKGHGAVLHASPAD